MNADLMKIPFVKYHGAGNDFICVDDRERSFEPFETQTQIAALCERRLGVGADGLILLRTADDQQLRMVYYNSDGAPSSFCGNGSRCFIHFAHQLGMVAEGEQLAFEAADGEHVGAVISEDFVEVSMHVSAKLKKLAETDDFVDTGSPHFIRWSEVLPKGEICSAAREVRYGPAFAKTGVNVNFVTSQSDTLEIRTYERGVEDETLACGTGITAAALSFAERRNLTGLVEIPVKALGGELTVSFQRQEDGGISNVILRGPAKAVYHAEIVLLNPAPTAN